MHKPTGHRYTIYQKLTRREAKIVRRRYLELAELDKEMAQHQQEYKQEIPDSATPEELKQVRERIKRNLDTIDRARQVRSELTGMMDSTLTNCFKLTLADKDKLELGEKLNIFYQLAEESYQS